MRPTQVKLNPNFTLEEHSELLEETRGVEVATATVSRILKRLGLPLKKTLGFSERDEQERAAFREGVGEEEPSLFVWVDECGTCTYTTCLYARAPKGKWAYDNVPRNRGNNSPS